MKHCAGRILAILSLILLLLFCAWLWQVVLFTPMG